MKGGRKLLGLVVIVLFTLACSLTGRVTPPEGSGPFSAQADSSASVSLKWQAVSGASGYLLEGQYGKGNFFQVAKLAGDRTEFTHFVVPGSAQITYRLSAITSTGNQVIGSAGVSLPALVPNPLLLVDLQPFAPTMSGLPNLAVIPTLDPQHPDPHAMATMEAYYSSLSNSLGQGASQQQVQPVAAQQEIGPQGGEMTLTSPNGVVFTLEIPSGAVPEKTKLTLTPIQTIPGFPFAGGPLAAVQVFPPLQFQVPLSLTIALPAGSATSSAPLTVGFAVPSFNHEFSLVPIHPAGDGSYRMQVPWGDTFGVAAATLQEVATQAGRIPSDAGGQIAQQLAALQAFNPDPSPEGQALIFTQIIAGLLAQADNLQTGNPAGTNAHLTAAVFGADPRQQSQSGANLLSEIYRWDEIWDEVQDTAYADNPAIPQLNTGEMTAVIAEIATRVHTFLQEHQGCRTQDDIYAKAILHQLKYPILNFMERLAAAYKSMFGDPALEKDCSFMLHITHSSFELKTTDPQGALIRTVVVHSDPFELTPTDRGGHISLWGFGSITYEKYQDVYTDCAGTLNITPPTDAGIWITDLKPVFDSDGRVSGFELQGVDFELGAPNLNLGTIYTDTDSNNKCRINGFSQNGAPPDWWGLSFAGMHGAFISADHWTIVGDESYVATDQINQREYNHNTENTTMVLTVNQK